VSAPEPVAPRQGLAAEGPARRPGPAVLAQRALLLLSFGLLLLVAAAAPSATKPALGPRGWAPGDLPVHLSPATVTATLWTAYLVGGAAVGLGLWRGGRLRLGWGWVLGLAAVALLTAPFGSADHTNYAAYGRIAAQGGDPYVVAPVTWAGGHDPVTSAVEPPWTRTPSIYGPAGTALQAVTSLVGRDNLRETVWVWQVLVVLAWVLVRWLLLRLAEGSEPVRSRVDLLWTANPVVFGVAVLGAHIDVIATVFALAAIVAAVRRPWLAGLALGAAVSTKITYGVVGLAIVWSWRSLGRVRLGRNVLGLAVATLLVAVPLHLWAGPHVFDQLLRARRSVSLGTPWRPVLELLTGPLPGATVRTLVSVGAVAVMVALAWALARVARPARLVDNPLDDPAPAHPSAAPAAVATFVLGTAYVLAAPYSLPWYDTLTWATLPVVAGSVLDGVLLARLTVMALAYVPGRVLGMTAAVEGFTLGFRRYVAPYAGLLAWVAIAGAAKRASRTGRGRRQPPRGTRPPAS